MASSCTSLASPGTWIYLREAQISKTLPLLISAAVSVRNSLGEAGQMDVTAAPSPGDDWGRRQDERRRVRGSCRAPCAVRPWHRRAAPAPQHLRLPAPGERREGRSSPSIPTRNKRGDLHYQKKKKKGVFQSAPRARERAVETVMKFTSGKSV